MTLWTFDFRSNDSDIEDDETGFQTAAISRSQQPTRQIQMDNELEELFGTMEESVEYKPNPWSIAKINAHSRNTAPVIKSKPKVTRKPASNSSPKLAGLERFWKHPKSIGKDGRISSSDMSPNAGKSLRDSISDALRRGGPVVTTQDQNTVHEVGRSADRLEPQLTDTTLSLDNQPLGTFIRPPQAHQPMSQVFALNEFSAYKLAAPAPGPGDQHFLDDSLCLSPCLMDDEGTLDHGFSHTPVNFRPGLRWETTFNKRTSNRFRTPSPERGPQWTSQDQVRLAFPYNTLIETKPESSPTVQLIARFAAPKLDEQLATSKRAEYSDPGVYRAESPIFAWSPPSPIPLHTQTSRQHTHNHALYPAQNPLSTPPRKKIAQFDPDDKSFWSTFPTPPSSTLKLPPNGINASRFRLPGSFLAGGASGRTLYKPPPRKRTRSRGNEESGTRWKVNRVG